MEKKIGIYKITNPYGHVYIGRSVNLHKRFNRYKNLHCKNQRKLYNSFLKYGFDSHLIEIVSSGDYNNNLLNELELHFIRLYNSIDDGLNIKNGGNFPESYVMKQETKDKISLANKGRRHTEETKEKLSAISSSRKHTEETKLKISNGNKNKLISKETRDKISKANKGRKVKLSTKIDISKATMGSKNHKAKKVINTKNGKIYGCAKEVALLLKVNYGTLLGWLQGKYKNPTNYKYYKEPMEVISDVKFEEGCG